MEPLADRTALQRQRARARKSGMVTFLHEAAIAEIQDRVSMVNKSFTDIAIITGHPELWRTAFPAAHMLPDEDLLALEPDSQDLVIHAMSLHWAADPIGQLIQCRRALKPDGLLLAILPGGQSLHALRACLTEAESALRGGLSARILPMGELRDMGALLQRAGFALPVADGVPLRAIYPDALALMRDLRGMGEANALRARPRRFTPRALFAHAAALYAQNYAAPEGGVEAFYELIVLTGWAPHQSQPQPLRPGSAQQRLADALGARETKLPD